MTPTILRTKNLRVLVYPKDHEPAHVHVLRPGAEAKYRLRDMKCIYAHGFGDRDLKRIQMFLLAHKTVLLEAWNDYQE